MPGLETEASHAALIQTPPPQMQQQAVTIKQPDGIASPSIQRSYAHEIPLPEHGDAKVYENCLNGLGFILGCIGMLPGCCCCNPFKTVQQGHVGLITRFGRYYKSVDPGLWKVNILTEAMQTVAIKQQIEQIPQQTVMSKDNVMIGIDSVLFWDIVEPFSAAFMVADVRRAIIERTMTTLRHIIGTRTLQDCIENRETIAHEIQQIIAEPARTWGVRIESMLIKDMLFSQELQETLSAAAKQKRIGESKIIIARAEVESAKLMREASNILNTPAAMQIRYLETLSSMSKNSGTKVIFMPTNGGTGAGVGEFKEVESVIKATVLENMAK